MSPTPRPTPVRRRSLLAGALLGCTVAGRAFAAAAPSLSDAEWRARLTPEQYAVLRESATEAAFSSPLDEERRRGRYDCAGCGSPLFASGDKFDSGTGWPSFLRALPRAVVETRDDSQKPTRTAVSCRSCGGHLGHVFKDGPPPTGLRYCMNGVALEVPRLMKPTLHAAGAVLALGCALAADADAQSPPMRRLPAPQTAFQDTRPGARTAMFGGGCFWGAQAVFAHVKGVKSAVSGYSGDATDYRTVSSGTTDSVESVSVTYDPAVVSYDQLLQVFFSVVVDPTESGGQSPDRGRQYQATIFYEDAGQHRASRAYVDQLTQAREFPRPIAVDLRADHGFHEAEPFHQNYVRLHPDAPYVMTYDAPRVAALKAAFPDLYAEEG